MVYITRKYVSLSFVNRQACNKRKGFGKMKKIISVVIILALIMSLGMSAVAVDSGLIPSTTSVTPIAPISVNLDGTRLTFDVPPMLVDGRVLVPMRAIFEALGAEVNWDDATRTATGTRGGTTVVLPLVGTPTVSGQAVTIDVPPHVVDGRILVPLRFVSQSFGADVDWDGNTRMVTITSGAGGAVTPPVPPQQAAGLTVNPEIFDIMGLTFNEIVARHGVVVNSDWFQGGYYYVHERGLGNYFYSRSDDPYAASRVETESDRENMRLFIIITNAQELFLNSFETFNRNDLLEISGVTVGEIYRNEMEQTYSFYFTYRNVYVGVIDSTIDGVVHRNSQVWVSASTH